MPSAQALPQFIEPMLLLPADTLPEGEQWLYELKWDGYRCQALKHGNNVRLFSRNGNDFTDRFPEIADAVSTLRCHSVLLDAEIVALDPDGRPCFQKLINGSRKDCALYLYAFDLLHLDGKPWLRRPLEERKTELGRHLRGTEVRYSAPLSGDPSHLMAQVAERELEGVVAKRRTSFYEPGKRSGAWIKWKALTKGEFIIGGYRPYNRTFDCLVIGEHRDGKLHFVARVLAGFTPRTRKHLLDSFQPLLTTRCPFVDLPWRTRGRWQDGITAADMPTFRWIKGAPTVHLGYSGWTDARLLRHPRIMKT